MHGQVVQPTGITQYLIPIAVFAVIFVFRMRRMSQMRPLTLERLWVVPAIYFIMVVLTLIATPPSALGWALVLVGIASGAVIGWYRGKTIAIHVDPATHSLNQKASPLGMLILLVLVGAKMVARAGGNAAHLDVASLTDALLGMALGTFAAMRVEMYLRGKRLLGDARSAIN